MVELRQEGFSNVETLVADAQRLDLPPASFDAAISRFGVMLLPAPQEALAAIHRALKPDGKLAALVWSTAERNPLLALPLGILQARGLLLNPVDGLHSVRHPVLWNGQTPGAPGGQPGT